MPKNRVVPAMLALGVSLVCSAQTPLQLAGGAQQITVSPDALTAMHHVSVIATNGHTHTQESFSGVPLIELLEKVGAPEPAALKGKALSDYVIATGSDGYHAVLSLAEIEPGFHPGEVIVADSLNGKPPDTKQGPLQLVVQQDERPARWVHNLLKLELKQAE